MKRCIYMQSLSPKRVFEICCTRIACFKAGGVQIVRIQAKLFYWLENTAQASAAGAGISSCRSGMKM